MSSTYRFLLSYLFSSSNFTSHYAEKTPSTHNVIPPDPQLLSAPKVHPRIQMPRQPLALLPRENQQGHPLVPPESRTSSTLFLTSLPFPVPKYRALSPTTHNHLLQQPSNASKFPDNFGPVYVTGSADEPYTVDHTYESGFCSLRDDRGELQICINKARQSIRQLWREEELSGSPWFPPDPTRLPTYDELSSSSVFPSSRRLW